MTLSRTLSAHLAETRLVNRSFMNTRKSGGLIFTFGSPALRKLIFYPCSTTYTAHRQTVNRALTPFRVDEHWFTVAIIGSKTRG